MGDPSDLLPIAGIPVGVGLWELGKWLVLGRLTKAEKQEEATEAEEKSKLDKLLEAVQRMERDVALISRDLSMHAGAVAKVEERINGMSSNHGTRISQLEKDIVELRTKLEQLVERPRRRSK